MHHVLSKFKSKHKKWALHDVVFLTFSIMMFKAFYLTCGLLKMLRKVWCKDVFKKFLILSHFYSVADCNMPYNKEKGKGDTLTSIMLSLARSLVPVTSPAL